MCISRCVAVLTDVELYMICFVLCFTADSKLILPQVCLKYSYHPPPPQKKNLSIPKDNRLMESSNVNQSHRKLFITKCLEYSAVRLSWVTCNCNRMCGHLFFIYLMLSVFLTCFGREIWWWISMWYYQLGDPKICVCLNLRDHS